MYAHAHQDGIGVPTPSALHTSASSYSLRPRYHIQPIQAEPTERAGQAVLRESLVASAYAAAAPLRMSSSAGGLGSLRREPKSMHKQSYFGGLEPYQRTISPGALAPAHLVPTPSAHARQHSTPPLAADTAPSRGARACSAGPKYMMPTSIGFQAVSGRRSPPRYGFGSSSARVELPCGARPMAGPGQLLPSSWTAFDTPGPKY